MASLGHPSKFQRATRLGSVTAWHSSSGRQPNFAPPIFGMAAITLALAHGHSSFTYFVLKRWKILGLQNCFSTITCRSCCLSTKTYLDLSHLAVIMTALRSRCGHYSFVLWFVMAALWNRAGHYILALSSSSSFPRLFSAAAYWISVILPHMVWP